MTTSIRDLDSDVYREFKSAAVKRGRKTGAAITEAMQLWMQKEGKSKAGKKSVFDIEPIKDKGATDWGERVDEILYGWKKK